MANRLNITRTASLSRHAAPNFVMLGGSELIALRKLPTLAGRLFLELLAMADHATGAIRTSYAVLLALVDFDQVQCAHAPDKPTLKRIRTAIDQLEQARLLARDCVKNEKQQALFLRVQSRAGISAPAESFGRVKGRAAREKKPAKSGTYAKQAEPVRQGEGQRVQENSLPPTPTGAPIPQGVREKLAAVRGAGGKQQAPQGGQNLAPAGHAPRGLRPPVSPLGDPSPQINRGTKGEQARPVGDLLAGLLARGSKQPAFEGGGPFKPVPNSAREALPMPKMPPPRAASAAAGAQVPDGAEKPRSGAVRWERGALGVVPVL